MLEQESRPMLFGTDGIIGAGAQQVDRLDRELVASGGAWLLAHHTGDPHTAFLSQGRKRVPARLRHLFLGQNSLDIPGAIPDHHEGDLSAGAGGGHPALDVHGLAHMGVKRADVRDGHALSAGRVGRFRGALSVALLLGGVNAACMNFRPPPKPVSVTLAGDAPAPVWSARAGRRFTQPVEIDGDMLYGGSIDRKVYAVNLANGEVRWSYRLPGIIAGGVLVAGDTVFAASSRPQGRISALRRSTGKQIWRCATPAIGAPLALINGVLVALSQRGEVLGIDPARGKILWRRAIGISRTAAIGAGEGGAIVATTDSLFRLQTGDGKVTNRAPSPGTVLSAWLKHGG